MKFLQQQDVVKSSEELKMAAFRISDALVAGLV